MSQSLAFVFPGQGSQAIGMLANVAEQFPPNSFYPGYQLEMNSRN